jgi:hypothetical protein
MRPRDTSPEAWKVLMDLISAMPPEARLQRAMELSSFVRQVGEAGYRQAHPDATDREVFLFSARQILGEELCRTVYGDASSGNGTA